MGIEHEIFKTSQNHAQIITNKLTPAYLVFKPVTFGVTIFLATTPFGAIFGD